MNSVQIRHEGHGGSSGRYDLPQLAPIVNSSGHVRWKDRGSALPCRPRLIIYSLERGNSQFSDLLPRSNDHSWLFLAHFLAHFIDAVVELCVGRKIQLRLWRSRPILKPFRHSSCEQQPSHSLSTWQAKTGKRQFTNEHIDADFGYLGPQSRSTRGVVPTAGQVE